MSSGLTPDLIDKIRNDAAASPPSGIIPDFENPPNGNSLAVGVIVFSLVITAVTAILRFYSKVFCARAVNLEDYLGLVSFSFSITGTWFLITIARGSGFFVHQWDLRVRDLERFLHAYIQATVLYCVALLMAKVAILLEWNRIFVARPHRNAFYWICYGMITANIILYLTTIIFITNACIPRERAWQRYLPGNCINIEAFNIAIANFHLLFDLLMVILPQITIWKLKLTTKRKFRVSVVFSGSAVSCVWAVARVVSAIHIHKSEDSSYGYSEHILWGLAEVLTAQVVFCVPAIPLVFRSSDIPIKVYRSLRSNIPSLVSRKGSVSNVRSRVWPRKTDPPTTRDSEPRFDDFDGPEPTCLQPVKIRSERLVSQRQCSRNFDPEGILITQEIHVMTHKLK